MAKGVLKSYQKAIVTGIAFYMEMRGNATDEKALSAHVHTHLTSIEPKKEAQTAFLTALEREGIFLTEDELGHILYSARKQVRKDTHQAMEGFIHNLNTMHSRGGNQVVFSSINYGTDTSPEGRMVIEELLKATVEGLGTQGEVPVFPIQIFKIKDGVSYSEADYQKAMADFETALNGGMSFKAPNFDLFLQACRTTAKALFPNFMFRSCKHAALRQKPSSLTLCSLTLHLTKTKNGIRMTRNDTGMNWQPWDAVPVYSKT